MPLQFQKSYKITSTARSVESSTDAEMLNFRLAATNVGVCGTIICVGLKSISTRKWLCPLSVLKLEHTDIIYGNLVDYLINFIHNRDTVCNVIRCCLCWGINSVLKSFINITDITWEEKDTVAWMNYENNFHHYLALRLINYRSSLLHLSTWLPTAVTLM